MRRVPRRRRGSLVAAAVLGLAPGSASCSSGGGGGGGASPLTLVSECDQICSQLATCGTAAASLEGQCLGACGNLTVVPAGCLDPLAAYLACLGGASSVQCGAGGQYVLVTPPSCESDRQAFLGCNAAPAPVAACVVLAGNTSCQGPSAPSAPASFCVGAPAGCTSPQPNPLGLGTYCCPD